MTDVTQPRMGMGTKLPASILAVALFALLAFAPLASAAQDPVASGSTTMTFKNGFNKKLKKKKIKLKKSGGATLKGKKLGLKVNGGEVDPVTGKGYVTNRGKDGFVLKYKKRSAKINKIEVNTNKKFVRAKVAGKRMKLANLGKLSNGREGFGARILAGKVKLTGKAAKQLNKKLGLKKAFKGGMVISNSLVKVQPETVAVLANGNKTTLELSISAVEKLVPLKVKLAPLAPAEEVLALPPSLLFPISGGSIAPDAGAGTVQHSGGLTLEQNLEEFGAIGAGTTTLTLANLFVDLTTKVGTAEITVENPKTEALNLGPLGRASIADIDLSGATISSDPVAHTVTVTGATASLQAVTAETLNSLFAEPVLKEAGKGWFAAGDPLGTISFTAQTQ